MFGTITAFLAPYRLYIFIALGTLAIAGVIGYGYSQKLKGKEECQQEYAEARADYEQKVRKEERKRATDALKKETEVSKQVSSLNENKRKAEDEARRLAREANRPSTCDLSDSERVFFDEAIRGTGQ